MWCILLHKERLEELLDDPIKTNPKGNPRHKSIDNSALLHGHLSSQQDSLVYSLVINSFSQLITKKVVVRKIVTMRYVCFKNSNLHI